MPQNKPAAKMESNGQMTFEPVKPGMPAPVDKTQPHSEIIIPPAKKGQVREPAIVPPGPVSSMGPKSGVLVEAPHPVYGDLKKI